MNPRQLLKLASYFEALAKADISLSEILKELDNLDSFAARVKFAEKKLKRLSSGSSRVVFAAPNKIVIKLAKNEKGIAQNKVEANPKMKCKFLNPVLKHAKDYSWIQTYFLEKITEKEFEKMSGIPFKDFGQALDYALKKLDPGDAPKPDNFKKIEKSEIYIELTKIAKKFKLLPGDLSRISSWGHRNNIPVLIDAGLTKKVFDDYYDDSDSSD